MGRGSPGYLYIRPHSALGTSTWALCTSTWALQTDLWSQEGFPGRFWNDFGPFREALEAPNTIKYKVVAVFHVAPQTSSRSSKSAPWKAQNDPQEAPRSGPEGAKTTPRAPKASQERPQSRSNIASERLRGPNWHKQADRRPSTKHFGSPAGRFCILRGSIFGQLLALGKPSQSCPVGKACASLRPAPLYFLV